MEYGLQYSGSPNGGMKVMHLEQIVSISFDKIKMYGSGPLNAAYKNITQQIMNLDVNLYTNINQLHTLITEDYKILSVINILEDYYNNPQPLYNNSAPEAWIELFKQWIKKPDNKKVKPNKNVIKTFDEPLNVPYTRIQTRSTVSINNPYED